MNPSQQAGARAMYETWRDLTNPFSLSWAELPAEHKSQCINAFAAGLKALKGLGFRDDMRAVFDPLHKEGYYLPDAWDMIIDAVIEPLHQPRTTGDAA